MGNGQPAPRAGTDALAAVCVLLAVVTQLCLVWAYPLLPTNDGPAHQLTAWIYRRDPEGRLDREVRHVGDLPPGLRRKLGSWLGPEVPPV